MKGFSSQNNWTWKTLPSLVCILFNTLHHVDGYSSGAAVVVCDTMIPGHGADPQDTPNPYKLTISKTDLNAYEPVNITLSSIDGEDEFKGFMIQVRKPGGDKAVGEFRQIPGVNNARTLNCFGIKNSAMTHTSGELKDSVTVQWIPPNVANTEYQVYYSVVGEDGGVYWTHIPHDEKLTVLQSFQGTKPPARQFKKGKQDLHAKLHGIYSGCGKTKGCFAIPNQCLSRYGNSQSDDPPTCDLMVTWKRVGNLNEFELTGKVVQHNTSYVALGLSTDPIMGVDSVVGCAITDAQAVPTIQRYFNTQLKKNEKHSVSLLGLKPLEATNMEGNIFCKFQQENHQINDLNIDFDNSGYHLLLSKGPVKPTSALGYHYNEGDKAVTSKQIQITDIDSIN